MNHFTDKIAFLFKFQELAWRNAAGIDINSSVLKLLQRGLGKIAPRFNDFQLVSQFAQRPGNRLPFVHQFECFLNYLEPVGQIQRFRAVLMLDFA